MTNPEGVPDDADYISPGEEPPEGYSVVEGPGGGQYAVQSEETDSEDADGGSDGSMDGGEEEIEYIQTEYGEVPDTDGPIPPYMRNEPIGSDGHPVMWKRPESEEELDEYVEEIQQTEWYGEGSEIFEDAFFGDQNTEDYHTDEEGNWDPQREEKHDEWAEELVNDDATPPEGEEPMGMIVLGPPGAGKGYWQEQVEEGEVADAEDGDFVQREFSRISSDRTKEPIPEYEETNASEVHDEASKIAKNELANKVFGEEGEEQNAIVDKVANSPDTLLDMAETMEEGGYDIRATFVDVPEERAVHNAVSRYFEEGRFTPLPFVREAVDNSRESFETLLEEADIPEDKVGRFDNDVEWGQPPEVEDMGEDLLKFYRSVLGWNVQKSETYNTIEVIDLNEDNGKTRTRRKRDGDSKIHDGGFRGEPRGGDGGGPQRGERRDGRRGIVDTSFNSPIGGERVLSRVHTSDLERQETVEKRIEVSNVRQVPNDVLAQADGADTLYYVSKRDYVPQNWTSFAQRADSRYKEQSESILERLNDTYRNQVWPDDLTKASRTWTGDEDVDDAVKNWVDDVINEMDPLHDQYDGVPALASLTVQKVIRKSLTQPQGWSVRSVAQNLQDEFDWMERDQAENIARQEVAAVLNTSKSVMFRAAEKQDEQYLYDWVGPDDSSTSHICEEIKERIEEKGGKVSFDVLEDTIYNVAEKYRNDGGTPHRAEELVPHYNCRYTVRRVQ